MIIVNFSSKEYARPQARLKRSLEGHRYLMFNEYQFINSPTHHESPYEFKIHAIREALKYDNIVLWADSSMYLVGDLSHIENIIKEQGYFAEEAGHYVGRWTNKHTREYFNMTPDELVQGNGGITMFSAGLLGLNKESVEAMHFLDAWEESAKSGCFKGDWNDHRHDMTAASIIATRLGWKYQRGGSHLAYIGDGYNKPEDRVVFYCQGMP
jgi:hypothetical protein